MRKTRYSERITRNVMGLAALLLLSALPTVHAQRPTDSTFFRSQSAIPTHLKPIERTFGPVYYYGGKRLRSPYSLEIPFNEINDPQVNRYFRTYRTLTTVGQLVTVVPLFYVLTRSRTYNGRSREYWFVYGGSVAVTLGCTIIGGTKIRQAVTRYNQVLALGRFGLSVQPIPGTTQTAIGVGLAGRFK